MSQDIRLAILQRDADQFFREGIAPRTMLATADQLYRMNLAPRPLMPAFKAGPAPWLMPDGRHVGAPPQHRPP